MIFVVDVFIFIILVRRLFYLRGAPLGAPDGGAPRANKRKDKEGRKR